MRSGNAGGKNEGGKNENSRRGKILQAGAAVGLVGLCATGVASGVACPILMGAAGLLAFSALRRDDAQGVACASCALPTPKSPAKEGPR